MTSSALPLRLLAALCLCALAVSAAPGPRMRAAGGALLRTVSADRAPQGDQVAREPGVVRSRYVDVDLSLLRARGDRVMLREPAITLELFPDVTVFAEFERYDPSPSGVTWVGRIEGMPQSTVTLAYGRGLLTGSIATGTRTYHIRPAAAGGATAPRDDRPLHVVLEVAQEGLPPEAPPVEVRLSESQIGEAADAPMNDTADVIDVMVVYTALAAAHRGGTSGILSLINLTVSETNTSYANSGVTQRIRLAHAAEVPYVESSNFSVNLSDLRAGAGGLAGVSGLRDAYGADLVQMLVHPPSPSACGIAYLMTQVSTAFAPSGFSVSDTACVSPGYTFAHELGHNMGARHDWYVDSAVTPYTYAHGYVNPAVGERWRTIMAYPDMCSVQGFSCTRLLAWANPERNARTCDPARFNCALLQYWYFPGVPMGVPGGTATNCQIGSAAAVTCDADDRRTLNNTALSIANFRQAVR